jgi:hypothetical protein
MPDTGCRILDAAVFAALRRAKGYLKLDITFDAIQSTIINHQSTITRLLVVAEIPQKAGLLVIRF